MPNDGRVRLLDIRIFFVYTDFFTMINAFFFYSNTHLVVNSIDECRKRRSYAKAKQPAYVPTLTCAFDTVSIDVVRLVCLSTLQCSVLSTLETNYSSVSILVARVHSRRTYVSCLSDIKPENILIGIYGILKLGIQSMFVRRVERVRSFFLQLISVGQQRAPMRTSELDSTLHNNDTYRWSSCS
jgi:hypothetical protein